MIGRNKVELIGYLGHDPEYYTDGPNNRATFSVATSESYLKKNGEPVEVTYWHDIVCWGVVADRVSRFLRRGCLVMVEGKLTYWEMEKEGFGKVKRASIKVDSFILLKDPKGVTNTREEQVPTQPIQGDDLFKNKGQVNQQPVINNNINDDMDYSDSEDDLPF